MTTVRQTVWRMACAGFYLLCCASCDDDSVAAPDGHTPPSESDVLDVSSWEDVASGEGEADGSGPDIDSPESFPWACNTVAPPPATPAPTGSPGDGAFYGRVLDDTCAPLYDSVEDEGFSVLACTDSNCVTGKTASDGTYHLTGLPTGPHKMQLLGAPHGYPTLVWYQDAVAGEVVALSRDIVVPPVGAEWVA